MPPKLSIEDARAAAEARGGECISETYVNCRASLNWRCEKRHEWKAGLFNIRQGRWCPTCANEKRAASKLKTIYDAQQLAATKGGKCLSEKYVHSKAALEWECGDGHRWRTSYNCVSRNRWCPTCANLKKADALRTNSIELAREIAAERRGKCLSETYTNSYTHLLWECEKGHTWSANLNRIKDTKRWCPLCSCWRREAKCRSVLEELTGKKFPPAQPRFLQGLKYDGYCPELGLAFEHNGKQHYERVPFFQRNEGDFEAQQRRDTQKYELSTDNWVALLVVPYWACDIRAFIAKELRFLGLMN